MKDYSDYYKKNIMNLCLVKNVSQYDSEDKLKGLSESQLISIWDNLRWTYGDLSKKK